MKTYSNCITPAGKFIYGIHKPSYRVTNLRSAKHIEPLGLLQDGTELTNSVNFPETDVVVDQANWIFEIPNPFSFRGVTFIDKSWADASAADHTRMHLPRKKKLSFQDFLQQHKLDAALLTALPRPLLITLATCSTDPEDLKHLAESCCHLLKDDQNLVTGLHYTTYPGGRTQADITDHDLFEAVANNPFLPDDYKRAMVLRPGAQGTSEIIGEWPAEKNSHVFEYLRRNSYISGGHFAANMADDAVRYSIADLSSEDMRGLRHLYYQRMYVHIAALLGLQTTQRALYSEENLEMLRLSLLQQIDRHKCANLATLWGWNFGFDYSPTDYRLHASHQQIHQQYAVIPEKVVTHADNPDHAASTITSFCCGDMIAAEMEKYSSFHGSDLFTDYFTAINSNVRMDNRTDLPASLVVWQDENVLVFVPKAQTSQWELQIMTKPDNQGQFPGNILETDSSCRESLNSAILKSQQIFARLGATMVTSIEYSKRIAQRNLFKQPLLYSLLPKLPFSPGAFSEAQLRFINGHYPEDFAAVCRKQLSLE
ncbi:MAG: hypothetical protein V2I36_11720 [Desulfopila sp.]|jgi:hypothetical protein|nr:hypothetical protein [Desulfopila sp.]